MEEDLLVMVGRLDEAKVVLECGHEAEQSLGVALGVQDLDGHSTLQTSALHFTNTKLHLHNKQTLFDISYT